MPPYQNGPNDQNGQTPNTPPAAPYHPPGQTPPAPQPYPQAPAAPQEDPNRYDFFLNPNKQSRGNIFGGGSSKKLMLISAGIVAVLVLVVVVTMAASSNSKSNALPLLSVAQAQEEVIRVAADGTKNAQATSLKNFSVTAQATVTSAQLQVLDLMGKQGTKLKSTDKQLKLTASAQTDKALDAATAASTYDSTYKTIIQSDLDTYENKLDAAIAVQTSKSARSLLQSQHDAAVLLEKQLNQP